MAMTPEQLSAARAAFQENPEIGRRLLRKLTGCTDYAAFAFLKGKYGDQRGRHMYDGLTYGTAPRATRSLDTMRVTEHSHVMSKVTKQAAADRATADALRRENAALRRDRDDLLSEFDDFRSKRAVQLAPAKHREKPKADKVRVTAGDVHGMMMDREAVAVFLRDLATLDPDEVVLLGDMIECGGFLARHITVGFVALTDYSYQEDIAAANWFLDEVQKAAPHAVIHYLEGNHEDRVERWCVDQAMAHKRDADFLLGVFGPQKLLNLANRGVHYYRRSEIYCEGLPRGWIKIGKMCFVHELGASKNAARDAVCRAAANVTFGHTHREDEATVVFPGVGIVKAFNPGCLCSIAPVWKKSDPTSWSQGYAIDIVAKSGNFQRIHVPIWRGESLAGAMIERFKS